MAYFKNRPTEPEQEPERLFIRPVQDDFSDDEDLPDEYDDLPPGEIPLTDDEEAALRRRDNLKVAASVGDFIGVIVGTVVILMLLVVFISLIKWLNADLGGFIQTLLGTM